MQLSDVILSSTCRHAQFFMLEMFWFLFLASVFICEKVRDAFGVSNKPVEVFHASL